ncbi:hypothetical protein SOVF_082080 [Spinacia oleracea]|nr:hypothetical protein SOVF_082080 [Spinacia oleracea]
MSEQDDQHNADSSPMKQFMNIAVNNSTEVINSTQKMEVPEKIIQKSASTSFRCEIANGGAPAYMLAEKMKELEMMDDVGDVDHTLDVEEALHYYSRLTCPEYVDIVNNFFMDMYADFRVPQPSITISSSSRRLGPLAL